MLMQLSLFLFLFLTTLLFTCVSVSSQGWDGPIFHIVGNNGSESYTFNISGTLYQDPDLTLIKGQTYQFSIDYNNYPDVGTPHPFGFTSTNINPTAESLGAIGNEWCNQNPNRQIPHSFITHNISNPCIVNYTANNHAFYVCAFHQPMIGKLTVITNTTNNNSSTSSPTTSTPTSTSSPTTPTSTSGTPSTFNGTVFHIIGDKGQDSYTFNVSGVAVENPSFDLVLGQTYQFSIDYINDPADRTNGTPHPFGFTTVAPPTVEALGAIGNANCKTSNPFNNTFITTDVEKPCIITYVANINTFYQCSFHPRMRGALNIIGSTVSSSSSSSSTGVNAASSIFTSIYLSIIPSLIALVLQQQPFKLLV